MKIMELRRLSFFILFLLGLSGCPEIGYMVSPITSAADEGFLKFSTPLADFVDNTISAGTKLGYQVSSVDRQKNEVTFTKSSTTSETLLIGKYTMPNIKISLPEQTTISISANLSANFNQANQATVGKLIGEFKKGLSEKFSAFGPQL